MQAISEFYMPFLIPLAIGLIVGIIAATKLLERAMDRHPQPTYLMILGFILGSIFNIFPGIPSLPQAPVCLLTFAAGFTASFPRRKLREPINSRFVFQECSESSSADRLFAYAATVRQRGGLIFPGRRANGGSAAAPNRTGLLSFLF